MAITPKQSKRNPSTLKKLKTASWSEWIKAFNSVHNSTMYTSLGNVIVRVNEKKNFNK